MWFGSHGAISMPIVNNIAVTIFHKDGGIII